MNKHARNIPNYELILDVAAGLFREKGYKATTIRDIAKGAGLLPGTLHYWFPSKELILAAMTERALVRVAEGVQRAADKSNDPAERLRLALRAYIEQLLTDRDAMVVLLYEFRSLSGELRAPIEKLRDRVNSIWDGLLHQAAGAGTIRPGVDVRMTRLFGLGAVNWMLQWYSPEGEYSVEQIVNMYLEFFSHGAFVEASGDRKPAG